ncbi:MAG: hypothetical protein RML45_01155 [Acetobacteraceae bacterium]|nr:hypothetical protein [Acetobacteraceae bacterium]
MRDILRRLSAIPHLETVRVHSRVPVADPERITEEVVAKRSPKARRSGFSCT